MPYYMIKNFNDTLTNDIVSFEQLGPGFYTTNKTCTNLCACAAVGLYCSLNLNILVLFQDFPNVFYRDASLFHDILR